MKFKVKDCVNALNGLTSFLHIIATDNDDNKLRCQRPERAYFISTFIKVEDFSRMDDVSTP